MAAVNSSVLACNYVPAGTSDPSLKLMSVPSVAPVAASYPKLASIRAQAQPAVQKEARESEGRRAALLGLAAVLFTTAATTSSADAGVIEEYLEKSKANKELNDKKRLATSGANFARAYTVEFGTCKFPQNFTGCQDLAKKKKVPFLSDDLEIECEGKDKYKCGSNVFWKWILIRCSTRCAFLPKVSPYTEREGMASIMQDSGGGGLAYISTDDAQNIANDIKMICNAEILDPLYVL